MLRLKVYSVKIRNRNQCKETRPFNDLIASFLLTSIIKKQKKTIKLCKPILSQSQLSVPSYHHSGDCHKAALYWMFSFYLASLQCTMHNANEQWNCKHDWFLHPSHCIGHYLSKYLKSSVCCCLIFASLQKCKNTVTPRPDIPPQSYFFFFPIYSEVPNWFGNGVPFR